jgi:outer membrane receptor for ferrienterochelin and colicins
MPMQTRATKLVITARVAIPLVASFLFGNAAPVCAQSVDYGALEQLFGEPITTSVTGKPQRATAAPANLEIVTQDDIRRSGATSIPDVLQFVTGIDVRRSGIVGADVGIRGNNQAPNPFLMVLVDGRQVYLVDYGRAIWPNIPVQLDEIRQIEVIKGPNAALYGFNAASGVINIITYDPLQDRINTATLRGGTQGYLGGSVVGTGQIGDKAGMRVSFGGFRSNDFAPGNLPPLDQAARRSPFHGSFNLDTRAQVTPDIEAFADISMADTSTAEQSPAGPFDTSTFRTSSFSVGVNAETGLGLLSLSAYRTQLLLSLFTVVFTAPINFSAVQTTEVVQISDLLKLGSDHTLRFGFEYRHNAEQSQDFTRGTISNAILAANIMWDWQLTPRLSLTNAVRFDHLQLHYSGALIPVTGLDAAQFNRTRLTETSFNSGLVWNVTDRDTLRLMAARGVRLPTLLEYGLQTDLNGVSPVVFSGRPDLHPSVIWNTELDYDRALPAIGSTLRTALFAQRIDDLIGTPLNTPPSFLPDGTPIFLSKNVGYSTAAGVEIGLRGHAEYGLRWNFSYAVAATTDHTILRQGGLSGIVAYDHATPRHVLIGGIGYTRDKLELDLMARWQSSFLDFHTVDSAFTYSPVEISDYLTLNARLGYRLTDNVLAAVAAQQFNRSQVIQTAGPPVERRIIATVSLRL